MVDAAVAEKLEAGFRKLQAADDCKSLLKKYLTPEVFDKLKGLKTPTFGSTLLDVIQSGKFPLSNPISVHFPYSFQLDPIEAGKAGCKRSLCS